MTEIWKDVVGYEGLYKVSNFGNVLSLNYNGTGKSKLLKQFYHIGYRRVMLVKNGIKKKLLVHRLVAEAFIPNPNNYPCVNHKDENRGNNHVDNLEWCTYKYNSNYGTCIARRCSKYWKPVNCYDLHNNLVKSYKSITETENDGFIISAVAQCCKGKRYTHKSHVFRFA